MFKRFVAAIVAAFVLTTTAFAACIETLDGKDWGRCIAAHENEEEAVKRALTLQIAELRHEDLTAKETL